VTFVQCNLIVHLPIIELAVRKVTYPRYTCPTLTRCDSFVKKEGARGVGGRRGAEVEGGSSPPPITTTHPINNLNSIVEQQSIYKVSCSTQFATARMIFPRIAMALALIIPYSSTTAQPEAVGDLHGRQHAEQVGIQCPYSLAVYLGNGCFWHTQYDLFLVERSYNGPFGASLPGCLPLSRARSLSTALLLSPAPTSRPDVGQRDRARRVRGRCGQQC
jgi:hypothetical protein